MKPIEWQWGPFEWRNYFGYNEAGLWSIYFRRIRIGRLRIHTFYRGDADKDYHDHKAAFWTFPLTSYMEDRLINDPKEDHCYVICHCIVRRWRLHFRPALYKHRVTGRLDRKQKPFTTITWWRKPVRDWGFTILNNDGTHCWKPWKQYINGDKACN